MRTCKIRGLVHGVPLVENATCQLTLAARSPQGIGGETRCNRNEGREGKACPNFATPPTANWVGVGRSDAIMMARSEGGVGKGGEGGPRWPNRLSDEEK